MSEQTTQEAPKVDTPDFQAMIDKAVRSAIGDNKPKAEERKTVEVEAPNTDSNIIMNDIISPWERDAGNYINAITMFKRGNPQRGKRLLQQVRNSRGELTNSQKNAEINEAKRIIQSANISEFAKKRAVQSIGIAGDGGNLLPKPFFAEVFVRIEEHGVARRVFRGIPMPSDTLDLKNVLTKPLVGWEGELDPIGTTKATFGNTPMTARKLAAIVPWSVEFQEDEVFGFLPLITELLAEAMAEAEDRAGFSGAGAGDTANAEFTGMLNLSGNTLTTLTSRDASDVNFDNISEAIHSLTLAAKRNAIVFANPEFEGVFERLKDNEDRYLYKYPGSEMGVPRLWNKPVEYVQSMPTPGDLEAGDLSPFIVIGDPRNMFFGTRAGIQLDVSTEGTIRASDDSIELSAFQDDAALLRAKERIAFESVVAGSFATIRTAADPA